MSSKTMNDQTLISRMQETPIAVIGMASVFADAKNLNQYWDNILEKINSIIDVPASRWAIDDYYSDDKNAPDKTYCKRGAFIPEIDFDPMEFGLPPNILEVTDIAQLLALVVAKEVINDAGIGDDSGYDRDKAGVILGVGGGLQQIVPLTARLQTPVLAKVLTSCGVAEQDQQVIIEKFKKAYIGWEENSFPGMLGNVIAGRIANRFDLGGTNCVVDAACAGSLAAIRMAVADLLEHRSEVMITGGICCDNSPFMYMSFSKTPAFTTNDDIRPFDENSKGMMVGEGIGMVALKRLADAERDGDRIYAVLKGIGTSSDGRFKSIYAPRPDGQAKALQRAYQDAGVDAKTVGLIEAHGTGTMAGDAAEFNGLNKFFGTEGANATRQSIALGSVKSQIGHTKSAAGAAGFIKTCLALHHKVLPPTINVDKPSSKLGIEDTPFYINSETRPWLPRPDGAPRRAGISSFGFGGTNFHFVLEEYQPTQQGHYRLNPVPQSLLFVADNKAQLEQNLNQAISSLQVDEDEQAFVFRRLVKANALKTPADNKARLGFVAKNASEALSLLQQSVKQLQSSSEAQWSLPAGIDYREKGFAACGATAALFSGQGSQYVNMGRELACNFPGVLADFAAMDEAFAANGLAPLSQAIFPIPVFSDQEKSQQEDTLRLTQFAQPAIGSFSVAAFNVLKQAGFKADFTAGHSFGELTALWAAGVLSDKDYRQLALARGQAMAAPDDKNFDAGTMIAVVGAPEQVSQDISGLDVSIANYNSNTQVVVAGATDKVKQAFDVLKGKGYRVVQLPVSAAFHTPLVGHAQKPFAAAIEKAKFNAPQVPVYANGTGKAHSNKPADIKKALKNHILESVRFKEEIDNLYQAGARVFIEFGPKNVLAKLVENILADKSDVVTIAVNANAKKSSDLQLRQAAVKMAVNGVMLSDLDNHAVDLPLEKAKTSPMAMKLSAAGYVSDKTKQAFTDALNDGYQIQQAKAAPQVIEKIVEKVVDKRVEVPVAGGQALMPANHLMAQQDAILETHQQFMQGSQNYQQVVQQALTQTGGQLSEQTQAALQQYHDFQTQTLKVHEHYLSIQTQYLAPHNAPAPSARPQAAVAAQPVPAAPIAQPIAPVPVAVVKETPVAVKTRPAPVAAAPVAKAASVDTAAIEKVMLNVVAEKTGYPVEMLELSMDMEADLGIDSIKRVEILGAVQDQVANLPELNPEDLAELRTLGQIVDYMNSKAGAAPAPVAVAPVAKAASMDTAAIEKVMLSVVAEKTGYPVEMLELSMDMEADLGIDSIKRVEILGAVQDQVANLPELNPEDLAELRTLGQIVDYMNSKAGAAPAPVAAAPVAQAISIDTAAIEKVMLNVVAEKTGYPVEMLELSMDMEADLGIDSIKRVEILGAVQDQVANLPELNPEDLAELRTLGQIVDYMNSKAGAVPAPVAAAPVAKAVSIDTKAIEKVMLNVVAEKTGYPVDMLELSMDMEADLGIDSIKRVEILGAVQDQITNLPELNPEDLAELRTLGQIVDYMNSKAGAAPAPVSAQQAAPVEAVNSQQFEAVLLQVVADKTGYPIEMLELDMDMEADLGIDSIKRVEILGAAQDAMPGLPEVNPETLAEMRSLKEIVAAFAQTGEQTPAAKKPLAAHAPSAIACVESIAAPLLKEQNWSQAKVLLCSDNTALSTALAEKLAEQGAELTILQPEYLPAAKKAWPKNAKVKTLSEVSEPSLEQALKGLAPSHVIYLHKAAAIKGIVFPEASQQGLALAFLLAKYSGLKQNASDNKAFVVVTHQGGQFGFGQDKADLVQGGLHGLAKTLKQEWPAVLCRAVDLDDSLKNQTALEKLWLELNDSDNRLAEVAINAQGRFALVAKASDSYSLSQGQRLDKNSVFLVSGGAKGVTAHCVKQLAQQFQCRFILLGRSPLSAEPGWAQAASSNEALKKAAMQVLIEQGEKPTPVKVQALVQAIESGREITATLEAVKQAGGQAQYLAVDVTDGDKLKSAVKAAQKDLGAITGIIHGAGVLADQLIEKKSLADFERVYHTKITGLAALLACVDADQLQQVVLFSSAAGFYGNPAQSDYSMANEILNKTALRFKTLYPQAQVLSFNWGPWDGGMVNEQLKRLFTERGVYIIPLDAGAQLLANEMNADSNRCPLILVGNDMNVEESALKKSQTAA